MIAGAGSKDQAAARRMALADSAGFEAIIAAITDVTVTYLSGQIEQGVEAVQLFDSWAGSLSPAQFERWVLAPNADIVQRLKALHPDTPILGFPQGAGGKPAAYARDTGVDAPGPDEPVDPLRAAPALPPPPPVQGKPPP